MGHDLLPEGVRPAHLAPAVAVAVAVFWLLPRRARDVFLAAASFALIAAIEPGGAVVLLGISLAVFLGAPHAARRRWVGWLLVLGLLAHLAAHKYVPPILAGGRGDPFDLAVPLGISYYTFKLIHHVVESARGNLVDRSLPRFLAWILLFPTFTAGPIERYDHFLENREDRLTLPAAVEGLTRIVHGLVKKLVLAGLVWSVFRAAGGENAGTHLDSFSPLALWGLCGLMYLFVYLDFSAYSDLAIGASQLLGIRIAENFCWPILARSIGEFWQRWHMTLAGWCRSYVYMPMIGLTRSPYVAVIATFLAIGLWHAGAARWALWGLYHALGVVVYQTWRRLWHGRRPPILDRAPARLAGIALTNLFVASSFALTVGAIRGGDLAGVLILLKLFGFGG
jgi:alginate O-acetyltransferase complex protein AlgI